MSRIYGMQFRGCQPSAVAATASLWILAAACAYPAQARYSSAYPAATVAGIGARQVSFSARAPGYAGHVARTESPPDTVRPFAPRGDAVGAPAVIRDSVLTADSVLVADSVAAGVAGIEPGVALRPAGSTVGPDAVSAAPAGVAASATEEPAVAPAPTWDLEVEANAERKRVSHFVDIFTGRLKEPFQKALGRQAAFSSLIEARLRGAGLPLDLTYLALVESYYDPHAYSRAAAVGMWQFMARTARGVGLRVDWWVDERRDPVRATEGAVRFLGSLNDAYGSTFLAAAAYNGGPGRVNRGLAQYAKRLEGVEGEDRFFALSDTRFLRAETRDYIPKIIAAALVAKQPDRYGLVVDSLPAFAFDSVLVGGGTPMAAVAAGALVPVDSVRDLNPHLLRGMVPEGDSMWVRVPVGAADGFAERLAALDSTDLVAVTRVKSKTGESMASIARKHAMTSKQLGWYNPKAVRLKSGNLAAGQVILVPSKAVVSAARDVPNPAIERYPRRARSTTPARPATKPAAQAKPPVR